jgi:hypothetical protein
MSCGCASFSAVWRRFQIVDTVEYKAALGSHYSSHPYKELIYVLWNLFCPPEFSQYEKVSPRLPELFSHSVARTLADDEAIPLLSVGFQSKNVLNL